MRIIVCGGREFRDLVTVRDALGPFRDGKPPVLVHGACRGADLLAAEVAARFGWPVEPHRAEWDRYGAPRAAHIRNQEMVDAGADLLIAFPGGAGTADCVRRAEKAGIPVERR